MDLLNYPLLLLAVAYVVICYIVTHFMQRTKLELVYKKGGPMEKIVEASQLRTAHDYVPYIFAWAVHLQGLVFVPYSLLHEAIFTVKYHREIF